ncbi:MAG: two-component system sensor histidine kinase NtrB [Candidatus Binataceae bacterium]
MSPRRGAGKIEFARGFAEQLIATAQVIIKVLDLHGGIVRFNPYMEEVSGYRMREMEGHDWFATFLPAHEQDRMRAIFARCVRGKEVGAFASTMVSKDGMLRAIDWRASALRDGSGSVVGVLSIRKDITQRVQAERELYELNKVAQQRERLADVGAIAAQIVHDVGNPLAALSMQAQLIRKRAREYPDQAVGSVLKSAEQMVAELHRLESLVREFMNFAREQRLDLRPIDLPHFLSEVAGLWHQVAFARGIHLIFAAPDRLKLNADEEKLHRVFDNLVKNAVEAIGEGPGRITISAKPCPAAKVKISVADSGPGIAKHVEVFRLFESTKVDGSGLGLAVARQIVLAHGGSIYFDTVKPHGTVFHVELPLQGPATVKAAATLPGLRHP